MEHRKEYYIGAAAIVIIILVVMICNKPKPQLEHLFTATSDPSTALSYITSNLIVSKMICAFSGPTSAIPSGWVLCNGQNGTPNLQDYFLVGVGTEAAGTTGGASMVTMSLAQMPSHTHTYCDTYYTAPASVFTKYSSNLPAGSQLELGDNYLGSSDTSNNNSFFCLPTAAGLTGSGSPISFIPSFYSLAFIMKS